MSEKINTLVRFLSVATGWKRFALCFAFGAVTTLALPPLGFVPVVWLTFSALVILLRGTQNLRQAFIVGWSFSFGYFVLGLYWMSAAMFVDIARFWWALPLSFVSLPAFLSLFYGVAMLVARRIGVQGVSGVVTVALVWFAADYARGHVLTGLPWNLIGYTWDWVLPMLQVNSVIGIYGLTLVTLVFAVLPAGCVDGGKTGRRVLLGAFAVMLLMMAAGEMRLLNAAAEIVPDVRLRLVQPNIDQANKWKAGQLQANFDQLLNLTAMAGDKPVTHVVWPESATGYDLIDDKLRRLQIAAVTPANSMLLTGIIRYDVGAEQTHYYNALIAMDKAAKIVASYDKFHLVPFGEYVPFRSVLRLKAMAAFGADFSAGDHPHTLHVDGLPPLSPLICYEAIFPAAVIDKNDPPQLMVNVTNDGWYRQTAGPHQHFAIARVRAIEEGMPLARAANTGISGMVDSYGRVTASLALGRSGFVDADLPKALPPTLYARFGDIGAGLVFAIITAGVIISRRRESRQRG